MRSPKKKRTAASRAALPRHHHMLHILRKDTSSKNWARKNPRARSNRSRSLHEERNMMDVFAFIGMCTVAVFFCFALYACVRMLPDHTLARLSKKPTSSIHDPSPARSTSRAPLLVYSPLRMSAAELEQLRLEYHRRQWPQKPRPRQDPN